ncbi:MAG: hypothetical protein R3C32_11900 [Chloroflexota bacterium]
MSARSNQPSGDTDPRLVVGLVRGLYGLRGSVRVEVLSDDPARFDPGSVLFVEGSTQRLTVLESHADGPGPVRFLSGPTARASRTCATGTSRRPRAPRRCLRAPSTGIR